MIRRVVPFAVAVATVLALLPGRVGAATTTGPAGRIFLPNPVVTLHDQSLTDRKDADYAALQPAYRIVALDHLDGSGYLQGDFVTVRGSGGRAFEPDQRFLYGRSDTRFEQVMAYYAITRAQEYIQSLGFTDIQSDGITVKVNQYGIDNSYFDPTKDLIRLGKGGVDDAEDLEVIWHEYGHAIQEAESPGFGVGHDAGSIGEGFGDYWAATMSQPVSGGYGVTCIADWDSVSYTVDVPHCLRRVDTDLTVNDQNGRIHHDGQIWSRALWDIHTALGRTTADTIVLTAQYHFNPSTTFRDAALEVVDAARSVGGTAAANVARTAFEDRGIL
jgi:Fungalysin metallopeptidase (M36)